MVETNQPEIIFRKFAEREAELREHKRLKRRAKTTPQRNRKLLPVPSREVYISRLLEKTNCEGPDSCWGWIGCKDECGYGKFNFAGESLAHRISWLLFIGDFMEFYVCHKCDNPGCINPKHLFLGTQLDNMRDCRSKGRFNHAKGEGVFNAKMRSNDVREMRAEFALKRKKERGELKRKFAARLGVSPSAICCAVYGRTWKSI